jgi:high-affinity iron transporter
MIGQYLITFREALEAALIIIIVLAYLKRTDRLHLSKFVMYGVMIALGVSFVLGISIWLVYGGITDSQKKLFEGIAALVAVGVLTTMVIWMATKGKKIKDEVEKKLSTITTSGMALGLVAFSFIAVFREGLETVLFLTPFMVEDVGGTLLGATIGIITSLILSYFIFVVGMKINLRKFFYFTSVLLVFLAAGLIGYGVHELIEFGGGANLGWFGTYAYNLNISSEHILSHKGAIGSIFAVMFGYTTKAEWGRIIFHLAYLSIFLPLVLWFYENPYLVSFVNRIKTLVISPETKEQDVRT